MFLREKSVPACLILHFDGSCWPNPGGPAAYGWTVHVEAGDSSVELLASGRDKCRDAYTTNNLAEYRGVEAGLVWLDANRPAVEHLTIVGDSRLVINGLNSRPVWKMPRSPHLAAVLHNCRRILDRLACPWTATWVPRALNAEADALSR